VQAQSTPRHQLEQGFAATAEGCDCLRSVRWQQIDQTGIEIVRPVLLDPQPPAFALTKDKLVKNSDRWGAAAR